MSFVDFVEIVVQAGDGGDGGISFRHEKYIDRGGPDGGDGGDGGNIIFQANYNQDTLANFRYKKLIKAGNGQPGRSKKRHGSNGQDKIVLVPVGTLVYQDNQLIVDLCQDQQSYLIAHGGRGGFGNAHFVSSTRQAPKFAEKGLKGENLTLRLELKMIADVGLIGLPNIGKSSLLKSISQAQPKIANYPFTTLKPVLGVVDVHQSSILFADIPGLIAGASQGKGLGFEFLRHIERTKILVHLIDSTSLDPVKDYQVIRNELKSYKIDLVQKPEIIVFSKIDLLSASDLKKIVNHFKNKLKISQPILAISSFSRQGIKELLELIYQNLNHLNVQNNNPEITNDDYKTINLDYQKSLTNYHFEIKSTSNNTFLLTGQYFEDLVNKTDFNNDESLSRLKNLLIKKGVVKELRKNGANDQSVVLIDQKEIKDLFN